MLIIITRSTIFAVFFLRFVLQTLNVLLCSRQQHFVTGRYFNMITVAHLRLINAVLRIDPFAPAFHAKKFDISDVDFLTRGPTMMQMWKYSRCSYGYYRLFAQLPNFTFFILPCFFIRKKHTLLKILDFLQLNNTK